MADDSSGKTATQDPLAQLKDQAQDVLKALGEKAMSTVTDRVGGLTDKLTDVADGGGLGGKVAKEGGKEAAKGGSPVKGAVKGGFSGLKDKAKGAIPGMSSDEDSEDEEGEEGGGAGGGGGNATKKAMNIAETIDVGVPVRVAYNQWTQYEDWPDFMKKLESAKQDDDEPTANFKGQVFWSHRTWKATIKEQVPDERIVWRSTGAKGHVDGSVTFHELAPRLTRILVVLEYYPQGFFEKTGNLWRAQGRRARLELKHFRRHVMMNTILEPDEAEGWRGEIHDEEVTKTHEEALEEEQQEQEDQEQEDQEGSEEEYEDEGEPEDEYDEEESEEDEGEEEEPEEAEDEEEPEEEPEEEAPRARKKSSSRRR